MRCRGGGGEEQVCLEERRRSRNGEGSYGLENDGAGSRAVCRWHTDVWQNKWVHIIGGG